MAREQELEPNTVYNYRWLLGLIYPHVGAVRASRLSARMVERAYRDLEAAGYYRTTLRTLNLVLMKAFVEQTGRNLNVRKPRESDDERQVWTLAEARRFSAYVSEDRLYPMWRLLLVTGLRRGELCAALVFGVVHGQVCSGASARRASLEHRCRTACGPRAVTGSICPTSVSSCG